MDKEFEFKLFVDTEFVAMKEGYYIREMDNSPCYSIEQLKALFFLDLKLYE
jgi:hypothetical protein